MVATTALALAVLGAVAVSALPYGGQRVQVPFLGINPGKDSEGGKQQLAPSRDADMAALLDKYAPVFKLASSEIFYPSSVKYMLDRYAFVEHKNGTTYRPPRHLFTPSGLAHLPQNGTRQLLSLDEEHNAQPHVPSKDSAFLYGPAGQEGGMKLGEDGRGRVEEEVYGFWVDQGRGVVDLWYWTFYPYNLGKEVGALGWLGNHVVDWEHLRIRTVNGTAESADFDTHSGGKFSAGTYRWQEIERFNDRPVAYIAMGSHGMWPVPGKHVYAQLLNLWQLYDITDDNGAIWDTHGRVVPIQFWNGPDKAEKMMDGPPGPNRRLGRPPECILGKTADESSRYAFYLSHNISVQAEPLNVTSVVVEQICARPSVSSVEWSDNLTEPELETWAAPASSIPFTGSSATPYNVTMGGCGGSRSAAKAYRVALYDGAGERVSTSDLRVLCIYEAGEEGSVSRSAVDIHDLDEWRWLLKKDEDDE
ncbi:Vacuolar protein sorting-associated protein 62 [Apiotrichum porosum]|uniref:Vacuolar protein sorting-associated protein 62 n=1 Tax=Apiotrichum porosum TaxID=105984 RepID=A0A427XSU3_9TREE|nr:Vacuolar protein sorting-associated protein 62 [Apiotrichum porosum]RSH81992.1 Vacuolar protein sorting-associated protein 62 [Apiotrichum porosum]